MSKSAESRTNCTFSTLVKERAEELLQPQGQSVYLSILLHCPQAQGSTFPAELFACLRVVRMGHQLTEPLVLPLVH